MPTGRFCQTCGAWRGQLGLEPDPYLYIEHMTAVFAEVRRVLRPDGTCWVNMGDSYATGAGAVGNCPGGGSQGEAWAGRGDNRPATNGRGGTQPASGYQWSDTGRRIGPMTQPNRLPIVGLKPKDLCGMPWRLAFALQADGWYLRQDIIWHKPNPMPESVTDRPTKAHEYMFLLSKSPRYYYDAEAVKEPASESTHARVSQDVLSQNGSARAYGGTEPDRPMHPVVAGRSGRAPGANPKATYKTPDGWDTSKGAGGHGAYHREGREKGERVRTKQNASFSAAVVGLVLTRNKRSVWTIPTAPYKGAHFATFPPKLVEPCILAGCPAGGVVLDPFGGSGTVGAVALGLGRRAVLIELSDDYLPMIRNRCAVTPGLCLT